MMMPVTVQTSVIIIMIIIVSFLKIYLIINFWEVKCWNVFFLNFTSCNILIEVMMYGMM